MFSGIGGFELGINGRGECIGHSEIDKYAIQVYRRHFNSKNYGDATQIDTKQLPNFDFLVGGFPCQAFSIAGKRRGFDDTRGTLFFEIARVLSDKRPRHFLLENVKGLLSHDSGKTFAKIVGVLTDLGYRVEWQVLNSKYFGVPQNRERVFFAGHLRGECRGKVFPITGGGGEVEKESGSYSYAIDSNYYKGPGNKPQRTLVKIIGNVSDAQRLYDIEGISKTIKAEGGGQGAKTGLYEVKGGVRRLTPTECARLQGFPDNWCDGLSDRQKYKCYGNAVTVNVITAIIIKFVCLNQ